MQYLFHLDAHENKLATYGLISVIFCILLFPNFIVSSIASSSIPGSMPGFVEYRDLTTGVQIEYPSSWVEVPRNLMNDTTIGIFMSPNTSLTVVLSKFSTNMTLDEYTRSELRDITSEPRSKSVNVARPNASFIMISGIPGYQTFGMYDDQIFVDNWTLYDSTIYRITFFFNQEIANYSRLTLDPHLMTLVMNMLSSFRIIQ